jgi:DNA-binding sugar fermentation-stimulating protein
VVAFNVTRVEFKAASQASRTILIDFKSVVHWRDGTHQKGSYCSLESEREQKHLHSLLAAIGGPRQHMLASPLCGSLAGTDFTPARVKGGA